MHRPLAYSYVRTLWMGCRVPSRARHSAARTEDVSINRGAIPSVITGHVEQQEEAATRKFIPGNGVAFNVGTDGRRANLQDGKNTLATNSFPRGAGRPN